MIDHALFSLLPPDSGVMSRELLNTALAQAKRHFTLVGSLVEVTHAAVWRLTLCSLGLDAVCDGRLLATGPFVELKEEKWKSSLVKFKRSILRSRSPERKRGASRKTVECMQGRCTRRGESARSDGWDYGAMRG